jgi:hypothetical protein
MHMRLRWNPKIKVEESLKNTLIFAILITNYYPLMWVWEGILQIYFEHNEKTMLYLFILHPSKVLIGDMFKLNGRVGKKKKSSIMRKRNIKHHSLEWVELDKIIMGISAERNTKKMHW